MSSARSNASAIQKRTQQQQTQIKESNSSQLKYPLQEYQTTKISIPQAIVKINDSIIELKTQINSQSSNNNNDIEEKLSSLMKSSSIHIGKISDENNMLKSRIESLEKTISDLQTLVNTLSTKVLSSEK